MTALQRCIYTKRMVIRIEGSNPFARSKSIFGFGAFARDEEPEKRTELLGKAR